MQHCNYSKIHGRRGLSQMYAGSAIQSIEYTILFLFSFFFVLTVNLIILLNVRKDIIIFIFQCIWNTSNIIYSPVVSVVWSKCSISSGNRTPKLRTKPVLIAPQTAEGYTRPTTNDYLGDVCLGKTSVVFQASR